MALADLTPGRPSAAMPNFALFKIGIVKAELKLHWNLRKMTDNLVYVKPPWIKRKKWEAL